MSLVKVRSYGEATMILNSYPVLPPGLQIPAFLLAMGQEYGERTIARGRVRAMVEHYENERFLDVQLTPEYEPAYNSRLCFERDVRTIAGLLEMEPNSRQPAIRWRSYFYTSPRLITPILQEVWGYMWATERHVRAAVRQFVKQ